MKILITGANGYLGQGIVKSVLALGHQVIAADLCVCNVDERATAVKADLFSIENPYEYFGQPDVLLHLAWRDGFVHYSDVHINDLPRHYKFIRQMADGGVKQIVGGGSMHEVGFFEGSVDENTPCHPVTPYGIAKNALRDLTQMVCEQKNIVFQWLRGYYIVGNSRYGSSVFSKIAAAEAEGKREFPFTSGQSQYDFIDYADFCKQVAAAINQTEINGIINICTGYPEKLADRAERFIQENRYSIQLKYGMFPERPYDSRAIWGDGSKIHKILERNDK